MKTIEQVLKKYSDSMMAREGVVGVFIGMRNDGVPCIKILINRYNHEVKKGIPSSLDGVPVVTEETDTLKPMNRR